MSDKPHSQSPPPTASDAIQALLSSQIAQTGPLAISKFIEIVLGHPNMDIIDGKTPLVPPVISPQLPKFQAFLAKCAVFIWHICMKLPGNRTPHRLSNLAPAVAVLWPICGIFGPTPCQPWQTCQSSLSKQAHNSAQFKTAYQGSVNCVA